MPRLQESIQIIRQRETASEILLTTTKAETIGSKHVSIHNPMMTVFSLGTLLYPMQLALHYQPDSGGDEERLGARSSQVCSSISLPQHTETFTGTFERGESQVQSQVRIREPVESSGYFGACSLIVC
ncbi:predicted protein [Coccidioides posadasii str. Silveira]|uniref:Predicted protein n=1 Tax=Coccidioides posadasii (strain RMSCC 757 / Silveira) TaxID=443226 RepID=E9D533_COCPS|nr:predicted protein [Coccidioides posadasii str. Silveira]